MIHIIRLMVGVAVLSALGAAATLFTFAPVWFFLLMVLGFAYAIGCIIWGE